MTAMPPAPAAPGYPPQPASTNNTWAIVSLITGILGCFVITPFVAIVTGIIGIAKARPPVGGKGMAVAGIILGLLWIVGGGLVGYGTYYGISKAVEMAKAPAISTMNDLANGDIEAAARHTDMSDDELRALSEELKPLGKVVDFSVNGVDTSKTAGEPDEINLTGSIEFENGTKQVDLSLTTVNDELKIKRLDLK